MPDNINEQDQEEVQDDPVERLKERATQGQLSQARAQDGILAQAGSVAGQLMGATGGDGAAQKIKTIRNIIKIIKGGTAIGGSFGDIFISIPTFLLTGLFDLIASYVVPGWEMGKLDKLLTILGLFAFGMVMIIVVALVFGTFKYLCEEGTIVEQTLCAIFL